MIAPARQEAGTLAPAMRAGVLERGDLPARIRALTNTRDFKAGTVFTWCPRRRGYFSPCGQWAAIPLQVRRDWGTSWGVAPAVQEVFACVG